MLICVCLLLLTPAVEDLDLFRSLASPPAPILAAELSGPVTQVIEIWTSPDQPTRRRTFRGPGHPRLVEEIEATHSEQYTYTAQGRLERRVRETAGFSEQVDFRRDGLIARHIWDGPGEQQEEQYRWMGDQVRIVDPATEAVHRTCTFRRDTRGRVVEEVCTPAGHTLRIEYDSADRPTRVYDSAALPGSHLCPQGHPCPGHTHRLTYNPQGQLIEYTLLDDSIRSTLTTESLTRSYTYNDRGWRVRAFTRRLHPHHTWAPPGEPDCHTTYHHEVDPRGNWIRRTETCNGEWVATVQRVLSYGP